MNDANIRTAVCEELGREDLAGSPDADLIRVGIWPALVKTQAPRDTALHQLVREVLVALEEVDAESENGTDDYMVDGVPSDDFWSIVLERLRANADQLDGLEDIADRASLRTDQVEALAEAFDETEMEGDPAAVPTAGVALKTDNKPNSINTLMELLENGELILDPPWQRGDVWSIKQKRRLIESILRGIPLPSIILSVTKTGAYEVIDGKQRLSAIAQFLGKHPRKLKPYSLGDFGPSHVLHDLRKQSFKKIKDKEIRVGETPYKVKRILGDRTQIYCLVFSEAGPRELYEVFELYNTQGVQLKPGEIRNAVFQSHPTHRMLFTLAGERAGSSASCYLDDPEDQAEFTRILRRMIGAKPRDRYKTLKYLSRVASIAGWQEYLEEEDGRPVFRSTEKHIDLYFLQVNVPTREVRSVAKDVVESFNFAVDVLSEEAFKSRGRWNDLKAVTVHLAARILRDLAGDGVEQEKLRSFFEQASVEVEYPKKQQQKIIWAYHACFLHALVRVAGADPATLGGGRHAKMLAYLKYYEKPELLKDAPSSIALAMA